MTDKAVCGCGKPVRYATAPGKEDEGSCNKHGRCATYEELKEALRTSGMQLSLYRDAVNKIDDYFEYAMESKRDQQKVHHILENLTDSIEKHVNIQLH